MNYLIRMAFRNIKRNTRRSILAITSVMLSVAFIVCMQAFIGGFLTSLVKNYTKNECGHVRITTKKWAEQYRFNPVTENIENPQSIIDAIHSDPVINSKITIMTERVTFGVLLNNKGNNKTALALAGDPQTEKELLLLNKAILPGGRYITGERETIIGARIARTLGFDVGDTLKVMAQGSDYALHLRKFTIVGIFETGFKSLDDALFQISLSDARQLLRMNESTQQIILMIDNYKDAAKVASDIEALIDNENISVIPWTKIGDYGNLVELSSSMFGIIYLAMALLGAFIIGNIMLMIVMERRHEIGILKSMGMSRWEIVVLFITEGMVLGVLGSFCGIIIGVTVSLYFSFHGIDFSKMLGAINMPIDNVIYVSIDSAKLVQAVLIGVLASVLVSIRPSFKAAKMNPVEAIKSI